MATVRKRNDKWQAQVRRTGHPSRARSFSTKPEAHRWIRGVEAELDAVETQPVTEAQAGSKLLASTTIADLLTRYRDTATPRKRGRIPEINRLNAFLGQPWATLPLTHATPQVFSRYRDDRTEHVSPGTIIRELGLLRSVFETARDEWDVPLPANPVAKVRKPTAPEGRTRRLAEGELDNLLKPSSIGRTIWLKAAIQLAIETGMRRGELLNVNWSDVDLQNGLLTIPRTKTGISRRIPLTLEAVSILTERQHAAESRNEGRVFSINPDAFQLAWQRCKLRASQSQPDIVDLRFHDLRHEAVSRFFELGLSTVEVALISGHRDMRMLFRYTHLKPESIVEKFRKQAGIN
ncbi:integrase [Methylobacterium sp. Leaf99]|uniref:tyrosine-type recombinase/integrase n=1 Tax=Methylobacterium sp. Leaf99 TaxID=1736251 RepID=UPI0007022215|nr:site-specific integrase [Methylobacterium sp. Leaf99]KQP07721.1 integrase [Methylobacterium sp. Leaf99]